MPNDGPQSWEASMATTLEYDIRSELYSPLPRVEHRGKVTWLAVADARGHLMRASLAQRALARVGIEVDIVTTSRDGLAFLRDMGTDGTLMSTGFSVQFDERHNMDLGATRRKAASYILRPSGMRRDWDWLADRAADSDFIVNDIHPSLVVASLFSKRLQAMNIVHLFGTNMWKAIAAPFGDGNAVFRAANAQYEKIIRRGRDASFACIEHHPLARFEADERDDNYFVVPPIVKRAARSRQAVRAELGVPDDARLAAVYLNPHFRDPAIAERIERGLERAGYAMYAIAEGYAGRHGWVGRDPDFVDVVNAADVLVSQPGMGAIGLCRSMPVPFLALLTSQPEQLANIEALRRAPGRPALETVALDEPAFERVFAGAAERLGRASDGITRDPFGHDPVTSAWTSVFQQLIERAGC
jgi:hypothetical protein